MPTPEEMKFFEKLLITHVDNSKFLLALIARLTVVQALLLELASATGSPQNPKEIEKRVDEELERLLIAYDASHLDLPKEWVLGTRKSP